MTADPGLAAWLASSPGGRAIDAAAHLTGTDPLQRAAGLRSTHAGLSPAQAAAALEQVELRALAAARYGVDASGLLLTRTGLEQATRPEVARRRAERVAAAGARRVLDLTAGLGFDVRAFAAAGLEVVALERDPATSALLAANCPAADVVTGDAQDPALLAELLGSLSPTDVVFVDPARRDPRGPLGPGRRSPPERDPERWSPPWSAVRSLPHPRVAAKAAPSVPVPTAWQAEWVSVHHAVVECSTWSWPVTTAQRGAAVHVEAGWAQIAATSDEAPLGALSAWLHDPDPAVVRAGALGALCGREPGLARLDAGGTWLTGPRPGPTPFVRSFEVLRTVSGSRSEQRRQLAGHGVDGLTVMSRESGAAPVDVLRDLGQREGSGHVLVAARVGGRSLRVLCAAPRPPRS